MRNDQKLNGQLKKIVLKTKWVTLCWCFFYCCLSTKWSNWLDVTWLEFQTVLWENSLWFSSENVKKYFIKHYLFQLNITILQMNEIIIFKSVVWKKGDGRSNKPSGPKWESNQGPLALESCVLPMGHSTL